MKNALARSGAQAAHAARSAHMWSPGPPGSRRPLIPDSHPGSQPSEYFAGSFQSVAWALTQGPSLLAAHASFGLVLVLGSLALVFRARQLHRRRMTVAAVLGFLFIIGAGLNGASFLEFNEDFSSMTMAVLFAGALLSCAGILSWLAEPG